MVGADSMETIMICEALFDLVFDSARVSDLGRSPILTLQVLTKREQLPRY